ncbi:MAG: hypothetical protein ACLSUW_04995 [Akkermansia sp.]
MKPQDACKANGYALLHIEGLPCSRMEQAGEMAVLRAFPGRTVMSLCCQRAAVSY